MSDFMVIQKGGLKLLNYFFCLTFLLTPLIMYGQADSADLKQSLRTSLVSQYARPDINIQINASRFSGLLDTGFDITIISRYLWPKT